ncbi:fimbria assembly protein [Klebsiella aerogenes]|uniref:fimbria assembly protein n=1 Tax=Klebsiella aerogenes TaxID=548 RepID=UPI003D32087A
MIGIHTGIFNYRIFKLNIKLCIFLSILFFIDVQSYAVILGKTNIELKGTIVDLGCDINISDKNKIVNLGSWSTHQLRKTGDRSSSVSFTISLTGCPNGEVSAKFNGVGDLQDSSLLAINKDSSARNVAIEILDGSKKRVPLGDSSHNIHVDGNGNARLQFYANYYVLSNNPTAGSANSDAVFTINYE